MVNPCKNKLLALHLQSISFGEKRIATLAQLVEQRIRNAQVVGSSPTISSKTCVNTAFSQVFSFSEMHFKIHYATKNLTLFYGVRFCLFI